MGTLKTQKVLLVIVMMALLSACGSQTQSTDQSSTNTTLATDLSGKAIAYCTSEKNVSSELGIKAMAFLTGAGAIDPSRVRVRLSKVPSAFSTSDMSVEFYKWTATAEGYVSLDSSPLDFYVRNARNSFQRIGYRISSFDPSKTEIKYDYLSASDIQEIVSYNNMEVGTGNTSRHLNNNMDASQATSFFAQTDFEIVLNDAARAYKALRVVIRSSTGSVIVEEDVLLPEFYADVAAYRVGKPDVLINIHPNKDKEGQGWSQDQLKSFLHASCY